MSPKQPALLPEDGAKLIGAIQRVEDRKYQAICHAELHHGSGAQIEMPEYFVRDTDDAAHARIAEWRVLEALRLGSMSWNREYYKGNNARILGHTADYKDSWIPWWGGSSVLRWVWLCHPLGTI
jgi:hypothetical protein